MNNDNQSPKDEPVSVKAILIAELRVVDARNAKLAADNARLKSLLWRSAFVYVDKQSTSVASPFTRADFSIT